MYMFVWEWDLLGGSMINLQQLPHEVSLSDMFSREQYGQNIPTKGFCFFRFFPKACHCFGIGRPQTSSLNIWFCWSNKLYWVVQWISYFATYAFHAQTCLESSMVRTSPPWWVFEKKNCILSQSLRPWIVLVERFKHQPWTYMFIWE